MKSIARKDALAMWSRQLITLAVAVFVINFGQGLFRGAATNFYVDTLGLDGKHVLWLAGIREVPGLALMFIAALFMRLPLSRRAAVSVLLMGVGYGLFVTVNSYTALLVISVISSLGFHNWMPLQSSLAMGLTSKETCGRVMGALSSVRALSSIMGMGAIALSSVFLTSVSLRVYYGIGGVMIALAAILLVQLPKNIGSASAEQPRMLLKGRYWLYYVLTFFEGSRQQVFSTFGTLILVQNYGLAVWEISLILLVSGVVNLFAGPVLGSMVDRYGERVTLAWSYVGLALCFAGYATLHNPWLLAGLLICINLLVMLRLGLTTYVNRIAPPEELTPTLSAGVSINHVTSVGMSLLAGTLLGSVGYEGLCWGAATIITLSVPFALALKIRPAETLAQVAAAE